jgi:hypothetical protein
VVVEQKGGWWMLREPLAYVDTARLSVHVPVGFLTDFASIPRLFWNLAPPADPAYSAAAVVHDRLYETHEVPKETADALFYRAMTVQGTPRWKRWVIWRAVSWFGGGAWASGPERQTGRLIAYRALPPADQGDTRGGSAPA